MRLSENRPLSPSPCLEKAVTTQKIKYDLANFLPDTGFVVQFAENYKKIIKKYL